MHTGKLDSKPEHVLGPDHLRCTSVNVDPRPIHRVQGDLVRLFRGFIMC